MPDDPTETGKDSPIWIVTREVRHFIRTQYSEMTFEIFVNAPLGSGTVVNFEADPPEAIVKLPKDVVVTAPADQVGPQITGPEVSIETTPYHGVLPVRITATAEYTDAGGQKHIGKQIRFLSFQK